MKLCRHSGYKVIDDILEPRYYDNKILINVNKVLPNVEHYLIKFVKCSQYPDWFYMSSRMIRRHKTQKNGSGSVYVVPMSKREEFEPIKNCEHSF